MAKKSLDERNFYQNLGRRVAQARSAKGWEQDDLAREVGEQFNWFISRSMIANIENGRCTLSAYSTSRLERVLGVSLLGNEAVDRIREDLARQKTVAASAVTLLQTISE
jgi:ribosome-binding protein aMBF1 (putative translation factor)